MTARCRGPVQVYCCASVVYLPVLYGLLKCSTASATSAVFGALLLAGCSGKPPLPSYGVVPDFTLTDQTGAAFQSAAQLSKKIWVADFIFTNCPGPCPRMSSQMHQVQAALDGNNAVHALCRFHGGPRARYAAGARRLRSDTSKPIPGNGIS